VAPRAAAALCRIVSQLTATGGYPRGAVRVRLRRPGCTAACAGEVGLRRPGGSGAAPDVPARRERPPGRCAREPPGLRGYQRPPGRASGRMGSRAVASPANPSPACTRDPEGAPSRHPAVSECGLRPAGTGGRSLSIQALPGGTPARSVSEAGYGRRRRTRRPLDGAPGTGSGSEVCGHSGDGTTLPEAARPARSGRRAKWQATASPDGPTPRTRSGAASPAVPAPAESSPLPAPWYGSRGACGNDPVSPGALRFAAPTTCPRGQARPARHPPGCSIPPDPHSRSGADPLPPGWA